MNNKQKLAQMLALQDKLNTFILGNDWKNSDITDWKRAAWLECAELIEHIGWKWWKKQSPNLAQAHIELSDIMHFMLSDCLVERWNENDLLDSLENIPEDYYGDIDDVKLIIEELVFYLLDSPAQEDYYAIFFEVCRRLDLSFDELYFIYMSKNVLNIFRQDNGYKEGTYIKQWPSMIEPSQTSEDNVYLDFFMQEAKKTKPDNLYEFIYNRLQENYPG